MEGAILPFTILYYCIIIFHFKHSYCSKLSVFCLNMLLLYQHFALCFCLLIFLKIIFWQIGASPTHITLWTTWCKLYKYMDLPCAWQYPDGFSLVSMKLESEHKNVLRPNINGSTKKIPVRFLCQFILTHNKTTSMCNTYSIYMNRAYKTWIL